MLIVAVAAYVFGDPENTEERDRKRRRTLPYVLQRSEYGAFHALVQELAEQVRTESYSNMTQRSQ